MKNLKQAQLNKIASAHGINYETIVTRGAKNIASKFSRKMSLPVDELYDTLADLEKHPRFFKNIKQCIVIGNKQLASGLQDNEFIVVESIFEGNLGVSFKKVKLEHHKITAQILSNPIADPNATITDRKKGIIRWILKKLSKRETLLTCESEFEILSGKFFKREIVDHVWLNFYENLMVYTGELKSGNMLTGI